MLSNISSDSEKPLATVARLRFRLGSSLTCSSSPSLILHLIVRQSLYTYSTNLLPTYLENGHLRKQLSIFFSISTNAPLTHREPLASKEPLLPNEFFINMNTLSPVKSGTYHSFLFINPISISVSSSSAHDGRNLQRRDSLSTPSSPFPSATTLSKLPPLSSIPDNRTCDFSPTSNPNSSISAHPLRFHLRARRLRHLCLWGFYSTIPLVFRQCLLQTRRNPERQSHASLGLPHLIRSISSSSPTTPLWEETILPPPRSRRRRKRPHRPYRRLPARDFRFRWPRRSRRAVSPSGHDE